MDNIVMGERDSATDLESGGTTSEEDVPNDAVFSIKQERNLFSRALDGFVNGSEKGEQVLDSADISVANLKVLAEKNLGGGKLDKDVRSEIPRKKRCKKPPKPPRPPKSPLLDAADQKLVKEMTELAVLKRARAEQVKVLKKMKAAKAASSSVSISNVCAAIITILFCLIIILQAF